MSILGSLRKWCTDRINDYLCGRGEGEEPLPFHQVLDIELSVIDRKRNPQGTAGTDIDSAIQMASGEVDLRSVLARRGETTEDPHATADERRRLEHAAFKRALDRDLIGLSFSGGGIRSATFNLGVIQALADLRLLPAIDYLSTVSGGGYIGSWLSALTERENRKKPEPGKPHGIDAVQHRLMTRRGAAQSAEDASVGFLRQYSNYLSPRLGLLSADTWAIVATYLRNLVLNLLVVLPGLMLFLFVPWLLFLANGLLESDQTSFLWSLGLGMLATVIMGYNMAALVDPEERDLGQDEDYRAIKLLQPSTLRLLMIVPLTAAAYFASRWMPDSAHSGVGPWVLGVAAAYAASWAVAALVASVSRWRSGLTKRLWLWLVLTAGLCGGVAGGMLWMLARILDSWSKQGSASGPSLPSDPTLIVWGPPLVLIWFILLGVLQTGVMGRRMLDAQREWLSRVGAWLLIFTVGWASLFAFVVYGPPLLVALAGWGKAMLAGGWLAATLGGLIASRAAGADAGRVRRLVASGAPYIFIGGLFLLLSLGLSSGLAKVAGKDADWHRVIEERQAWEARRAESERRSEMADRPESITSLSSVLGVGEAVLVEENDRFWTLFADLQKRHNALIANVVGASTGSDRWRVLHAFLLLLGGTLLLAWRVDVNEFSMHSLYRNRLVRAYLGASVEAVERRRRVQPFTGFYRYDDLPLAGTDTPQRDRDAIDLSKRGPLHLINVALNLVGGDQLAWQERKAASFVLSPLFCGFEPPDEDDFNATLTPSIKRHGFRPTKLFASRPKRQRLSLGGAMAISGAAASPNMGFRSTAASAFLLTILNVRLGWWLGNPRHARSWRRSGPMIALLHLLQEISGSARGRTRYIYASDGGHFENLGIYELVRRRCRFIVACDAGADSDLAFDDLGGAIRKCRADFGVDIDLDLGPIREGAKGAASDDVSRWHCALGTVRYLREGEEGAILYVKASVTGDEPADVLNYRRQNPTFPHESTGDQFFDESQFESYRRLGHHVMTQVLEDAAVRASEPPGQVLSDDFVWRRTQLARLWRGLGERWLSPSRSARAGFTRLAETLAGLLERLRTDDDLRFLDAQFYPEWHRLLAGVDEEVPADTLWLPDSAAERSQGFYFCSALIQLMENVYIDLALDETWDDPDNRGWTNLFRHWSWSGMLRATWAITAATYGQRFQTFCADRLGLNLGYVGLRALSTDDATNTSEVLTVETMRTALEQEGRAFLNFYEREQIAVYLDSTADAGRASVAGASPARRVPPAHRVLQLEVVVPGAVGVDRSQSELLRFGFGYALVGADNQLVLFRVQDHLRRMGLGARALRELIADRRLDVRASRKHALAFTKVVQAIAEIPKDIVPAQRQARTRFAEEFRGGGKQLAVLLRSAAREIRDSRSGPRRST